MVRPSKFAEMPFSKVSGGMLMRLIHLNGQSHSPSFVEFLHEKTNQLESEQIGK